MFRIKICGITNPLDAKLACTAGADALGLNFYSRSSRSVNISQAKAIAGEIPSGILKVGVFVNASTAEINQIAQQVPLDAIQLHGDETATFLAETKQLTNLPVIKAYRCGEQGLVPLIEFLEACQESHGLPVALLIDAAAPGQYGGSGAKIDWTILPKFRDQLYGLPVILAGGLKPANVEEAIEIAQPDGVDVASGVEESPGKKDGSLVQSFITSAKQAFDIP